MLFGTLDEIDRMTLGVKTTVHAIERIGRAEFTAILTIEHIRRDAVADLVAQDLFVPAHDRALFERLVLARLLRHDSGFTTRDIEEVAGAGELRAHRTEFVWLPDLAEVADELDGLASGRLTNVSMTRVLHDAGVVDLDRVDRNAVDRQRRTDVLTHRANELALGFFHRHGTRRIE